MPTKKINCHCKNNQINPHCQAPLHGEITITTCERDCGWGCADDN